jgi:hypothetical protein
MRAADPSIKALVFSQYNSTLEWLQRRLPQEGFSFRWAMTSALIQHTMLYRRTERVTLVLSTWLIHWCCMFWRQLNMCCAHSPSCFSTCLSVSTQLTVLDSMLPFWL